MKPRPTALALLVLALTGGCDRHSHWEQGAPGTRPNPPTCSSFDPPGSTNEVPARMMRFVEADLGQVLALYQELSGRSIIRSPSLPPNLKISFENRTAMSRAEGLQALDNVLAAQNIATVYLGTRYVKVVPSAQASQESAPVMEMAWHELPDSSSYLIYIVKLKHLAPEQATGILQPFAKLPNSIIGVRGSDVMILRDYSSNVRRMMQVLEIADKPGTNLWPFSIPGKK